MCEFWHLGGVKFLGCFFIVKFSKGIFCLYSALDYLCIAYFLISKKI